MDYLKKNHLSLLIILFLIGMGLLGDSQMLGARADLTTVGNPWTFTNSAANGGVTMASTTITALKIGQTGTGQSHSVVTTCSMKADISIAATSTGYAYCTGVTGVTSSDKVQATFATSTLGFSTVLESWVIVSANASSTAGSIDFMLLNLTGAAAAPSANGRIGSTTVIRASY